jgi:hypothetical protein
MLEKKEAVVVIKGTDVKMSIENAKKGLKGTLHSCILKDGRRSFVVPPSKFLQ